MIYSSILIVTMEAARTFNGILGSKRTVSGLLIISLLALVLRLYFFIGLGVRDDIAYCYVAKSLLDGVFVPGQMTSIFAQRIGFTLPLAAAWSLIGVAEWTAVIYPLFCGLISVWCAALIGAFYFGRLEGLTAALLIAVLPIEVVFSTQIMPDLCLSALLGLSVLLAVVAARKRSLMLFAVAGLILGVAALTKEFAIIAILILPPLVYWELSHDNGHLRYFLKAMLSLACGSLFILGSYAIWSSQGGEAFNFISVIFQNARELKNANPDQNAYLKYLFDLYPHAAWFAGLYYLASIGVVVLIFIDFKRSRGAMLWLAIAFVFLQFIGPILAGRWSIERMERFLMPMNLPAALLAARLLSSISSVSKIARWGAAAVLCVFVCNAVRLTASEVYLKESVQIKNLRMLRDWIADHRQAQIYADRGSFDKLQLLLGYPADTSLHHFDPADSLIPHLVPDNAFVILYSDMSYYRQQLSVELPDHWVSILKIRNFDPYWLRGFDPEIFLVKKPSGNTQVTNTKPDHI